MYSGLVGEDAVVNLAQGDLDIGMAVGSGSEPWTTGNQRGIPSTESTSLMRITSRFRLSFSG
jgi:hypothetical protein